MSQRCRARITEQFLSEQENLVMLGTAFRLAVCFFVMTPSAIAQTTTEGLRKMAQNPFAYVIKVPIEEDIYFGAGPFSRNASSLQIQPIFPFRISQGWLLVSRIVATGVAYQPDAGQKRGGTVGLGDICPAFYFTRTGEKKTVLGIGPSLSMPTATSTALGSGRWALGPSLVVLTQPHWGSLGILVQNIWSFAGDSHRAPVKQMSLQYVFSYNLPRGWYLTTQPTISADWTQARPDRWVVPFGGGAGRTFTLGKQAVDANAVFYGNAIRPENQASPKWQLSLSVTLLFPKR